LDGISKEIPSSLFTDLRKPLQTKDLQSFLKKGKDGISKPNSFISILYSLAMHKK
jgi:hypothetical protein